MTVPRGKDLRGAQFFRVLASGDDGIRQTTACSGAALGGRRRGALCSPCTVRRAARRRRSRLEGNVALPTGAYRLLACDGLLGLTGLALDGDGDGCRAASARFDSWRTNRPSSRTRRSTTMLRAGWSTTARTSQRTIRAMRMLRPIPGRCGLVSEGPENADVGDVRQDRACAAGGTSQSLLFSRALSRACGVGQRARPSPGRFPDSVATGRTDCVARGTWTTMDARLRMRQLIRGLRSSGLLVRACWVLLADISLSWRAPMASPSTSCSTTSGSDSIARQFSAADSSRRCRPRQAATLMGLLCVRIWQHGVPAPAAHRCCCPP